jgi:hypothetical protein
MKSPKFYLFITNDKGEAAGTHLKNEGQLFTLASTRLLGSFHLVIDTENI